MIKLLQYCLGVLLVIYLASYSVGSCRLKDGSVNPNILKAPGQQLVLGI
jgi:hypothetical protein